MAYVLWGEIMNLLLKSATHNQTHIKDHRVQTLFLKKLLKTIKCLKHEVSRYMQN